MWQKLNSFAIFNVSHSKFVVSLKQYLHQIWNPVMDVKNRDLILYLKGYPQLIRLQRRLYEILISLFFKEFMVFFSRQLVFFNKLFKHTCHVTFIQSLKSFRSWLKSHSLWVALYIKDQHSRTLFALFLTFFFDVLIKH